MSTGMNFTCISAFDASKDIVWSFAYKLEGEPGYFGGGGFTTFLNLLSSLSGGGINTGLGYGPYINNDTNYSGVSSNFLVIAFEDYSYFALSGNGFTTGAQTLSANMITIREGDSFEYKTSKNLPFYVSALNWQILRFQLTNMGNTLNVYHCDNDYNYNLIASHETLSTFSLPKKMYIGMSFSSPAGGKGRTKLKVKDFHFYGNPLP
jgi:hypothetical protein